jgi:general secretion pathway protein G
MRRARKSPEAGLVLRSASRRREGGFTLIEMMVVIVIIGIIAGLLVQQLAGRADRAKVEATKAMISQVSQAVDLFKLDHNKYPARLEDLLTQPPDVDPKKWPREGSYLKKNVRDAWDNPFLYRVPGTRGQPYDLISLGEDAREGGEGYAEDLWNHEAYKR